VRWPVKRVVGQLADALNFLWLLSLFQDKESNQHTIEENDSNKVRSLLRRDDKGRDITIAGRLLMQSIDCSVARKDG
jgi:hypothetical protein